MDPSILATMYGYFVGQAFQYLSPLTFAITILQNAITSLYNFLLTLMPA